jgi:glycosyltransferase involved in cell wall biosynthesis
VIAAKKWNLVGDAAGPFRSVNLCMTHDPALAGLYRGVTAFSDAMDAAILSVEPTRRVYGPCEGHVLRLEASGGLAPMPAHYIGRSADDATESLLHDTRLLIVHSLFRGNAGFAMRWAAARRKDYWAVPHGCLDPWGMSRRRVQKRLWMAAIGRHYLARASRVIFSCQREADKASDWTRGARTTVVHFPVHLPDRGHQDAAKKSVREELGLSESVRILIYVGRLHAMKRPRSLLQAFLRAEAANVALVVVGGDDDVTSTELARAIPPSEAGRIRFTGALGGGDLDEAYLAADGFISLSHRENFGFSLAEACAYGLPFIATPGHDLVHEMPTGGWTAGGVGWVLPDTSEAAAVQAIRSFAAAPESHLRYMGQNARTWVADNLSPEAFRNRLTELMP